MLRKLLGGVLLVTTVLLLAVAPILAQEPPAGNSVPSDLDTKTHPFVENLRYGGKYFSGELLAKKDNQWIVAVQTPEQTVKTRLSSAELDLPPELLKPGTNLVLKGSPDRADGFLFIDFNRIHRYLILFTGCLLICGLIGGWITTRSLLALAGGIAYFLFWLVPRVNAGSPVLLEISLFYFLTALLILPNALGLNRRTLSAILTTFTTGLVGLGGIYLLTSWFNVSGLQNQVKLVLEYATRYHPARVADLNFTMLVVGSTLIGVLGVVLDVSVDVTSAAAEIAADRPDLSFTELIQRVLTVSRRLIGTMCNTLLLAYLGSDLLLIFTLYLLPTPLRLQLNRDLIAVEAIRGFGGALGFLIAVPLAVAFYSFLFKPRPPAPPAEYKSGQNTVN